MQKADAVYIAGMFTVVQVGNQEIDIGPALEAAGMVLVSREEYEDLLDLHRSISSPASRTGVLAGMREERDD